MLKPFVYGIVIFGTLGVTFANAVLSRIGLEGNYVYLFATALVVAGVMLGRNVFLIALLLAGVVAINLPEAALLRYHLDRDVLLAVLSAVILAPPIYELSS